MNTRLIVFSLTFAVAVAACGDDSTQSANNGGPDASLEDDAGVDAGADVSADAAIRPEFVATTEGPVQGVEEPGVWSFKGVPYAQPPLGELRWKAPREPQTRDGVLVADDFGPACPQDSSALGAGSSGPTDEDCLTLNIWTSELEPAEARPVLFWIHGGGFIQGSASQTLTGGTVLYDGADLAREDVVVVTFNYRLGALGFLAHDAFVGEDEIYATAGNYGLLDQIRALEWVRDNIASFGGDPDDITIFGESAGGVSVCALMGASATAGLFDSAIMQSGNCLAEMRKLDEQNGAKEPATAQGDRMAEALGCADAGDVAACMRGKSADEVLDALPASISLLGNGEAFEPIIDGELLDKSLAQAIEDGSAHDVPLVVGVNGDEGTLFAAAQRGMTVEQYEALVSTTFPNIAAQVLEQYPADAYDAPWLALSAIIGDVAFVCPGRDTARDHSVNGNDAYTYYFTHVTATGEQYNLGAFHASELTFVFGNFTAFGGRGEEGELSAAMQAWWTQFAYDGAPGEAAGLVWPVYEASADEGVRLDAGDVGVTSGFRSEYCDFWEAF